MVWDWLGSWASTVTGFGVAKNLDNENSSSSLYGKDSPTIEPNVQNLWASAVRKADDDDKSPGL